MKFRALDLNYHMEASIRLDLTENRKCKNILVASFEQNQTKSKFVKNFSTSLAEVSNVTHFESNQLDHGTNKQQIIEYSGVICNTKTISNHRWNPASDFAWKKSIHTLESNYNLPSLFAMPRMCVGTARDTTWNWVTFWNLDTEWLVRTFAKMLRIVTTKPFAKESWCDDIPFRSNYLLKKIPKLQNCFSSSIALHNKENIKPLLEKANASISMIHSPGTFESPKFSQCWAEANGSCQIIAFNCDHQTIVIATGNRQKPSAQEQCIKQALQLIMMLLSYEETQKDLCCRSKLSTCGFEYDAVSPNGVNQDEDTTTNMQKYRCKRKREVAYTVTGSSFKKLNLRDSSIDFSEPHHDGKDRFFDGTSNSHFEQGMEQGFANNVPNEELCFESNFLKNGLSVPDNVRKASKGIEKYSDKRKRLEFQSIDVTKDPLPSKKKKFGKEKSLAKLPRIVVPQVSVRGRYNVSRASNELEMARDKMNRKAVGSRKVFTETKLHDALDPLEMSKKELLDVSQLDMNIKTPLGSKKSKKLAGSHHQFLTANVAIGQRVFDPHYEISQRFAGASKIPPQNSHLELLSNFDKIKDVMPRKNLPNNNISLKHRPCFVSALDQVPKNYYLDRGLSEVSSNRCNDNKQLSQIYDIHQDKKRVTNFLDFQQKTARESSFQQTNKPFRNLLDASGRHPVEQNTVECTGSPVKILCSETFLETWGDVVATLACGSWLNDCNDRGFLVQTKCKEKGLNRRTISCIDSPLLDACGIDLEASTRCGFLIINVSQLGSAEEAKSVVLHLAQLAAVGRYSKIQVFICCDSEMSSSTTKHIVKVQFAAATSSRDSPTKVICKTTTSKNLAASLAHTIFSLQDTSERHGLFENAIGSLALERMNFLISLLPALSVGGAIQCLALAKSLLSADCPYYEQLFKNQRLRQQIMLRVISNEMKNELSAAVLVQLSRVLRVIVSKEMP